MGVDKQLTQQTGNPPRLVATPKVMPEDKETPSAYSDDDLIQQLIHHEGFRLNPYVDTEGYITGGVGHKFTKEDFQNWNGDWSREEKESYWYDRFQEDISSAKAAAERAGKANKVDPKYFPVLTEMAFNMGEQGLKGFPTFLKDLGAGNVEDAITEMMYTDKTKTKKSKWFKQVPNRVNSLVKILRSSK